MLVALVGGGGRRLGLWRRDEGGGSESVVDVHFSRALLRHGGWCAACNCRRAQAAGWCVGLEAGATGVAGWSVDEAGRP